MSLPGEWARCRGWIEAALAYAGGTHAIEDIEAMLVRGELYFLPGERSAMVLEHVRYPRRSVLNIFLAGGELTELLDLADGLVTEAARRLRCDAVSLNGRPGWKRVLASRGWGDLGVSLGKRVVDEPEQEQDEREEHRVGEVRPGGAGPDDGPCAPRPGHRR